MSSIRNTILEIADNHYCY